MRLLVSAQVILDDGMVQWGYLHDEVMILPGDDPETNALSLAGRMVTELDAAKAAIVEQAQAEVPKIAEEMREMEEFESVIEQVREEDRRRRP